MEYSRKRSCNQCRQAKTRCSLDPSVCSRCQKRKLDCQYEQQPRNRNNTPAVEGGVFHSWLPGTTAPAPPPAERGNSGQYHDGGRADPLRILSRASDGMEDELPTDRLLERTTEPIAWEGFPNTSLTGNVNTDIATISDHPNFQDSEAFWLDHLSDWSECLISPGRYFSPITTIDKPDSLSALSGALKQTSNLALASWQALKGTI
jgi:hypothetical protein